MQDKVIKTCQNETSDDQNSNKKSPKRKISSCDALPDDDQIKKKKKLSVGESEEKNQDEELQIEKQACPSELNAVSSVDNIFEDGENETSTDCSNVHPVNSSADSKFYKECKPCGKTFNGPLTYEQHLNSETHRKSIICSPGKGVKQAFECTVCNKTFSGPIPYDQHLSSKSHRKTLRIIELNEKFKGTQEVNISASIVQNDTVKDEVDKSASVPIKQLFCEICQKKFTGPIPYDAHLASSKHSKNVMKMVLSSKGTEESSEKICINEDAKNIEDEEIIK